MSQHTHYPHGWNLGKVSLSSDMLKGCMDFQGVLSGQQLVTLLQETNLGSESLIWTQNHHVGLPIIRILKRVILIP